MPPLSAQGHALVNSLYDIGPALPLGMGGLVAISETDLMAWQLNQGMRLEPWECRLIRRLSREYASMAGEAKDPQCPPPWVAVSQDTRDKVGQQLRAIFRKRD